MKTKNIKVSIEIEKPRRCGECPFFSYQEYRCHNEWGYESCCSLGSVSYTHLDVYKRQSLHMH